MINWQLSKQGIRWPVSPDRIAGSGVDPSRSSIFWSYPLTRYWFSNDRRLKFNFLKKIVWNMLCLCAAQLKFWFQTDLGRENSASYYRQGRQLLLTLLTMVTRWSRSTSNFYALIGQNLTGEFMWKIYTASWIIFVSTCDVFNSLFPLDVQNEIQLLSGVVCYSWLVGFWLRITSLVKVGNPISDGILFLFHLVSYVRVKKSEAILALLDTFQGLHLEW